ncbi:hypothetical protein DVH05_010480 [Phytophthora capsici]|nr:hypothetical protein DVH05_010480 [Phytophthora capsici]
MTTTVEDLEKCYAAFVSRRRIRGEQSIRTREGFQRLQKRYQLSVHKPEAEVESTEAEDVRRNVLNVFFNPKISRLITENCWRLALFGGGSVTEARDCSGLDLDAEKYSNFTFRLIQWAFPELPRQKVQELVLYDWENDRKFDEQEHDRLSLEGFKISLIDLVISCTDGTTPKCLEFLNLMARWLQHSLPPYANETPQVDKDFVRASSSIKLLPQPEPVPPSVVWESIPLSTMTPCQIRPQGLYCKLKAKVCTSPMVIMVLSSEDNPFELALAISSKLLSNAETHRKVTQNNGELKRQGCWTFSMNPKVPSILLIPGSTISRQAKAVYACVRTFDAVEPQEEEDKSDKSGSLLTLFTSVPDQTPLRFDSKTNVCLRMERLSSRIFTLERKVQHGEAFSITLTASLLQNATDAAFSSAVEVKSTFIVGEKYLEDAQGNAGRNINAHTFVFIIKSEVSSKKSVLKQDAVLPRQWFTSLSGTNESKMIIFESKKEPETDKKETKSVWRSEIFQLFIFTLHGMHLKVACNSEIPEFTQEDSDTEAQDEESEEEDVVDSDVTSASLLKELLLLQKMRQREKTADPMPDMVLGTQVNTTKSITTAKSLRNKSRQDERRSRLQELETAIQTKCQSKAREIRPTCREIDPVEAPPSPKSELEKRVHLLTTFFHEMAVPQSKLNELQGNEAEAAEAKAEEQLIKGFGALFHRDEDLQNALDEEKWSTDTAKIVRRRESIVTNLPRIRPIEEVITTGDELDGKHLWTFEDYENTAQYIEQLMVDVEAYETQQQEQQNLLDEEQKREIKDQLIASWQYTQHRVDKTATRKRIQELERKRRSQWMQSQQVRVYNSQSQRPALILPKQRFLVQESSLPANAVWEVPTAPNQSILVSGPIATAKPTSPCQSPSKIRPRPPKRPATVSTERRNYVAVNSAAISRARVRRIRSAYSTGRRETTPKCKNHQVAVVLHNHEEPVAVLPLPDENIEDNQPEVECIGEFETSFAVSNLQTTFDTTVVVESEESAKVKTTEKKKRRRKKKRSSAPKDLQFRSRVLELVSIAAQLQVLADEERKDAKGIENVEEFGCMPSLTSTFTSKST